MPRTARGHLRRRAREGAGRPVRPRRPTRNFSGIEPDVVEEKIYAKGVGVVIEMTVTGGSDRA